MADWRFLVLNGTAGEPPVDECSEHGTLLEAMTAAREWVERHYGAEEWPRIWSDLDRIGARYCELAHVTLILQPLD